MQFFLHLFGIYSAARTSVGYVIRSFKDITENAATDLAIVHAKRHRSNLYFMPTAGISEAKNCLLDTARRSME